jgi:hypothetical protein
MRAALVRDNAVPNSTVIHKKRFDTGAIIREFVWNGIDVRLFEGAKFQRMRDYRNDRAARLDHSQMRNFDVTYLRDLVRALSAGESVPAALRNECHRLMMAIDGNKLALIEECVGRIRQLAQQEGYALQTLPPGLVLEIQGTQ